MKFEKTSQFLHILEPLLKTSPEIHYGLLSEPPFVSYVPVSPSGAFWERIKVPGNDSATNGAENSKNPVTVLL